MKVVRPVRREGRRNLPLKGGKALLPYSTLPEVVRIAVELDFVDAAMWIEDNRSSYSYGVFCGFKVTEGGNSSCAVKQA